MSSIILHTLINEMGSRSGKKKTQQVGFKVDQELFDQLKVAADAETRGHNELARMIFEWAFPKYRQAGTYDVLIGRVVLTDHSKRRSEDVTKEVKMEAEVHGELEPSKKAHRSKAS